MSNQVQHQFPRHDVVVSIYNYQVIDGATRAVCINVTSSFGTQAFLPEHVAAVMKLATGWNCEDDDWQMLNNLHTHGSMPGFKFGNDWEWYVECQVEVSK